MVTCKFEHFVKTINFISQAPFCIVGVAVFVTCNVEKLVKTNDFCKFDTILHDRGCACDNIEF